MAESQTRPQIPLDPDSTLEGHEAAESILVTNDYEDVIDTAGGRVQCIPVAKFLLGFGSGR